MRLDAGPDGDAVAGIVRRSCRLIAQKKLAVQPGETDTVQSKRRTAVSR